jgi:hypothetical protein
MASTFKSFLNSDITTTRTLLHESIPITGSIVARTYVAAGAETNIKSYGHGMLQSVFDYPYLSSSANHIFDVTVGVHPDSAHNAAITSQKAVKNNIYAQMAQMLVGFDETGTVRKFDKDGNFSDTTTDKYTACAFISFSRLLVKDEIKKGTFELHLGVTNGTTNAYPLANIFGDGAAAPGEGVMRIYDKGAADEFRVNSPVGEYGILYAAGNAANNDSCPDGVDGRDTGSDADVVVHSAAVVADASGVTNHLRVGLIYYQAGIVVLNLETLKGYQTLGDPAAWSGGVLIPNGNGGPNAGAYSNWYYDGADKTVDTVLKTYTVDNFARGLRERVYNIQFNNTTELNSTIYFCRANHNEFNYSSNPTYLTGSKMRVKENTTDQPVSYLTSVGLYSADNELLAVAKLSEPLKKDPTNELTLRVRLDY